jgi:hypothetical protein
MSSYNLVANARPARASASSYDQPRRILAVKVDGIQGIVELNARVLNRWWRHECAVSVTLGWFALLRRDALRVWTTKVEGSGNVRRLFSSRSANQASLQRRRSAWFVSGCDAGHVEDEEQFVQ